MPLTLESVLLLNVHLGYKWATRQGGEFELALMAQNIFDTDEREIAGGVPKRSSSRTHIAPTPMTSDPVRPIVPVAYGGERHRRVVLLMLRGAY